MFTFKWFDSMNMMHSELSAYNTVGANTLYGILKQNKHVYNLKCFCGNTEVIFVNGEMIYV